MRLSYRAFYVTRFESFYLTFLFSPSLLPLTYCSPGTLPKKRSHAPTVQVCAPTVHLRLHRFLLPEDVLPSRSRAESIGNLMILHAPLPHRPFLTGSALAATLSATALTTTTLATDFLAAGLNFSSTFPNISFSSSNLSSFNL